MEVIAKYQKMYYPVLNPLQGITSNLTVNPPKSTFPQPSQEILKKSLSRGTNLAREIFFECSQCGGPLVPVSNCIVCKRTVLRRCVKCNLELNIGFHDSCNLLVILGLEMNSHRKAVNQ